MGFLSFGKRRRSCSSWPATTTSPPAPATAPGFSSG